MEYVIFLRGVMPTGKNAIPKMQYLADILTDVGFQNVRTYIQSGNIILDADLSIHEINRCIRQTIKTKIGADLKIIIKTKQHLAKVVRDNPFDHTYDYTRIHTVFCQEAINTLPLQRLAVNDGDEKLIVGRECLYLYLPKDAVHKKLNTNYLERILGIDMTMRKINVVQKLLSI